MKQFFIMSVILIVVPAIIVFFFIKEEMLPQEEHVLKTVVRVKRNKTGQIEDVPIEEYVFGVVSGEMPISFHIEALKAQAVAARTYVLKRMEYNKNDDYDVVDTVLNQVYLDMDTLKERWGNNYEKNYQKISAVIKDTQSEYLSYDGKVIDAMFFSTSNGYTENSGEIFQVDLPYLQSVKSEWDRETSPVFEDLETFKLKDFYEKLELKYEKNLKIQITEQTSTGRCIKLKINGIEMKASTFYSKLGLRSTDFDITMDDEIVYIKTKGYGHGVGMSQYGADGMAQAGYKYDQILKHYYQGVEIKELE